MTTPAPAATAPRQPQQQQPQQQQLALAAAEVLATAVTVAGAAALLASLFASAGIELAALKAALEVVMGLPGDKAGFYGPATAQVARLNLIRKAQFLVASSRRFAADQRRVASGGADPRTLQDTMDRERRYYGQHLMASWNREKAAAQVDSAAMSYGRLLGWYAERDSRTSPECRAAGGRNFWADRMPAIGYPGMVHLNCRCSPGPPFATRSMVGGRMHAWSRRKSA